MAETFRPTLALDTHELAWAAGFFDGEGSFVVSRRESGRLEMVATIAQVGRETLERFKRAVCGLGIVRGPYGSKYPNGQPYHVYSVGTHERAQAVMAMLWRYLSGPKRADAARALERMLPQELRKAERRADPRCPAGHPLIGPNSNAYEYTRKTGTVVRHCRTCKNERRRVGAK